MTSEAPAHCVHTPPTAYPEFACCRCRWVACGVPGDGLAELVTRPCRRELGAWWRHLTWSWMLRWRDNRHACL